MFMHNILLDADIMTAGYVIGQLYIQISSFQQKHMSFHPPADI